MYIKTTIGQVLDAGNGIACDIKEKAYALGFKMGLTGQNPLFAEYWYMKGYKAGKAQLEQSSK